MELEFRLCREFEGMVERPYRFLWCDGLLPDAYLLDGDPTGAAGQRPRIEGDAWIGRRGEDAWTWRFTLLLPRAYGSREEIEWETLMPAENMTCWIGADEGRGELEIEPGVAKAELL